MKPCFLSREEKGKTVYLCQTKNGTFYDGKKWDYKIFRSVKSAQDFSKKSFDGIYNAVPFLTEVDK